MKTIPLELRELLKKAEFISMIPKGKKPNMFHLNFVDGISWSGAFYRMFYGENRRSMVMEINLIVDQLIINLKNYQQTEFYKLIYDVMFRIKNEGLMNLIETYKQYPETIAELRVILNNIDLQLK
jgi:hypothetical protein